MNPRYTDNSPHSSISTKFLLSTCTVDFRMIQASHSAWLKPELRDLVFPKPILFPQFFYLRVAFYHLSSHPYQEPREPFYFLIISTVFFPK